MNKLNNFKKKLEKTTKNCTCMHVTDVDFDVSFTFFGGGGAHRIIEYFA